MSLRMKAKHHSQIIGQGLRSDEVEFGTGGEYFTELNEMILWDILYCSLIL